MSALPKGWTQTALDDVSTVVRGITFPASAKETSHTPENVCCLRTSNIQREVEWGDIYFVSRSFVKRAEQFVQSGDILMSMANSYELVGKVAIAKEVGYPTAFGAFLSAIRPTTAIDGKYLFHLLRTAQVQSELRQGSSQTTNIANISVGTLANIEVPLAPLPEQKRIADKLDTALARVDACRDRLDRLPALLKRFRQSILAAAFTGKLTSEFRTTETLTEVSTMLASIDAVPRPNRFNSRSDALIPGDYALAVGNPGTDLPKNWRWLPLIDIAKMESGHTPSRTHPEYWEGDVPWIGIADARQFHTQTITSTIQTTNELGLANSAARLLPKDTVCVSRTASVGYVVKMGCPMATSQDFVNWICTQAIDPDWLKWLFVAEADALPKFGKGTTHTTIYFPEMIALHVGLPPIEEQHEIVRRVDTLFAFADRLEARLATARQQVDQLTPALLAKAFRGELVPQDPADEPASELLKRLAAQREAAPPAKGRRRKAPASA